MPVDYDRKYFFSKAVQSEATQSSTKHYTIPPGKGAGSSLKDVRSTMSFSGLELSYSYKNTTHIYR
jgi:hypothetical protein